MQEAKSISEDLGNLEENIAVLQSAKFAITLDRAALLCITVTLPVARSSSLLPNGKRKMK